MSIYPSSFQIIILSLFLGVVEEVWGDARMRTVDGGGMWLNHIQGIREMCSLGLLYMLQV